jgi:hypothetical protein
MQYVIWGRNFKTWEIQKHTKIGPLELEQKGKCLVKFINQQNERQNNFAHHFASEENIESKCTKFSAQTLQASVVNAVKRKN